MIQIILLTNNQVHTYIGTLENNEMFTSDQLVVEKDSKIQVFVKVENENTQNDKTEERARIDMIKAVLSRCFRYELDTALKEMAIESKD